MRLTFVEVYHVVTLLAEMKTDATVIIAFRAFRKQVRPPPLVANLSNHEAQTTTHCIP